MLLPASIQTLAPPRLGPARVGTRTRSLAAFAAFRRSSRRGSPPAKFTKMVVFYGTLGTLSGVALRGVAIHIRDRGQILPGRR